MLDVEQSEESPMHDGIDEMSVEKFLLQSPDHIHEKECTPLTDLYDEDYKNYTHNDLIEKAELYWYHR